VKEGKDPYHGECEEEHDPQGQDGDCGKLALLLTDPDHLQPRGQEVHQFVDQEPGQERRQQMQVQHEEQRPTGEEPGGHVIRACGGLVMRGSHVLQDSP
jgi:hypothetical protein